MPKQVHIFSSLAEGRDISSVAFLEQYDRQVNSLDLSGPTWYAPSAVFFDTTGDVYRGGQEIWNWMKGLFGPFEGIKHETHTIRVIRDVDLKLHGENEGKGWKWGDLIEIETTTKFWLKGDKDEKPIEVRRMLSFVVGEVEDEGEAAGTWKEDRRLWMLEGKAWWDKVTLAKEIAKRKT